jgi:fumarylacetoacetate (FAA) hydrolase
MKLVTYRINASSPERIGVYQQGNLVDLLDLVLENIRTEGANSAPNALQLTETLTSECEGPMLRLLRGGEKMLDTVRACLASTSVGPLNDVEILAPVPRPTSMRDGYAFRQHVEAARRNRGVEMIPEYDHFPIFYFTNHQAVTGPGIVRVREDHLDKLDFELEAAIVIGREGRDIAARDADDYIAGYMVMNDWSARRMQMDEMKLNLGPAKGKDFATSIGPVLVTRDEIAPFRIPGADGERYDLTMITRVNGTEVSRGNMKDMSWTFAQILERASYGVTLYPGDVIGSGTVGTGCFLELNGSKITDNWWLKDGDIVECEIDALGTLENNINLYTP